MTVTTEQERRPTQRIETARDGRTEDLQAALRERNNQVGGNFLIEVPLGDGTDRVVQIIRPDGLKHYVETATDAESPPTSVDQSLVDFFSSVQEGGTRDPLAIPVVLPEIGPAWVLDSVRYIGGASVKDLASDILPPDGSTYVNSQGRNFLNTLEAPNGTRLCFVVHRGMGEYDTPSYAKQPLLTDVGVLTRAPGGTFRIGDRELRGWEGEVPKGISPVRGNASIELFNLAIRGAYDAAKKYQRFSGPNPDEIIRQTTTLVKDLK